MGAQERKRRHGGASNPILRGWPGRPSRALQMAAQSTTEVQEVPGPQGSAVTGAPFPDLEAIQTKVENAVAAQLMPHLAKLTEQHTATIEKRDAFLMELSQQMKDRDEQMKEIHRQLQAAEEAEAAYEYDLTEGEVGDDEGEEEEEAGPGTGSPIARGSTRERGREKP